MSVVKTNVRVDLGLNSGTVVFTQARDTCKITTFADGSFFIQINGQSIALNEDHLRTLLKTIHKVV